MVIQMTIVIHVLYCISTAFVSLRAMVRKLVPKNGGLNPESGYGEIAQR